MLHKGMASASPNTHKAICMACLPLGPPPPPPLSSEKKIHMSCSAAGRGIVCCYSETVLTEITDAE